MHEIVSHSVPTYERSGQQIPLLAAYALFGDRSCSLFLLTRKMPGKHGGKDLGDGTTPVSVTLPFDAIKKVTLHKIARSDGSPADPRDNNLKSAKVAGLHVNPACFDGALRWINAGQDLGGLNPMEEVQDYDWMGGKMTYRGPCDENANKGSGSINVMAAAALCRLHIGGAGLRTPGVLGPSNIIKDKHVPKKYPFNMYFGYYATLTMFQMGGEYWKAWNDGMKPALLGGQVRGGKDDGSWDPKGAGHCDNSRVMSTALCVMCLEVYYRYMPLYRGD